MPGDTFIAIWDSPYTGLTVAIVPSDDDMRFDESFYPMSVWLSGHNARVVRKNATALAECFHAPISDFLD